MYQRIDKGMDKGEIMFYIAIQFIMITLVGSVGYYFVELSRLFFKY